MSEIIWEKRLRKANSKKELRNLIRRYLKEHLKGLPPHFKIEVEILEMHPNTAVILLPTHSEGNLIRVAQVDRLVGDLESIGINIEVLYEDDLAEKREIYLRSCEGGVDAFKKL